MQMDLQSTVNGVWTQYQQSRSADLRRQLVLHYLGLVRYVVTRMGMQKRDRSLETSDVMQMGVLGLLGAIDRYNPVTGVKFETFAVPRIRGAIIDELREIDWMPRTLRSRLRSASETERRLAQEAGREVRDAEVARKLNISVDELRKIMVPANLGAGPSGGRQDDATESEAPDDAPDPLERLSAEEVKATVRRALGDLPERERTVLALYYYEELKMSEIAQVLEVTESRVSQLHARALLRLRNALAVERHQGGLE